MRGRQTPATQAAAQAGIRYEVHGYTHNPNAESYGAEAAQRMGVDPSRVFKTLVAGVDSRLVVAVVPVDRQLDLKALAAAAGGKKADMADGAAAERATGYVLGGISPLGQRKRLPTFVDESAADFETIYVSGGRRGLEIELAPGDLASLTAATFAAISRE
jgi:Cys-tRNA(Pro)/Cys-tRNA(Cys) deacylase